jgi:hypothetical protein
MHKAYAERAASGVIPEHGAAERESRFAFRSQA